MDTWDVLDSLIDDPFWQAEAKRYQYDATGLAQSLARTLNLEDDIDWLGVALALIAGKPKAKTVELIEEVIPEVPSS